ncbi:telomere-associated protein RIF1 [Tiliqua scincoides]|uniref:telomere-associated protein RIF1 n=1 Tax=Tiliqua scincoides TaxID=71010 RepID=UPI003462152D
MSGADSSTGRCPPSSLPPLLETLEDPAASPGALTDALLTLTSRLSGEEGKEFAAEVGKCFSQLYKIFKTHVPTENSELSSAALQALGFCVFNANIAYLLSEAEIQELFSILNSVAVKTGDKNTRTRALWVIAKQSFPPDIVGKAVPSIIAMLETVLNRGDLHSMVVEYEALNVIIRLIEQAPSHMEEQAVSWAKLIIPLVVHSAHKVQLRSATALEMGVPLLLKKQQEVAAVTEELMSTKIIPDLQKLFSSKNETYVLKLWPLFVKLLGKALHRSGCFINSLLQLEELGFRSGSPVVKKIAFIAWKSLIDNFALNPEILCSSKRLKLLMQPLSSIHVRTEVLALTKVEVWWYLLIRLGPQLPAHFEQVCVPLIQSTVSLDASLLQGNSSRVSANQTLVTPCSTQKSGAFPFGTPAAQRKSLNSSVSGIGTIPSIQLLGIEMLLHFFMGPGVLAFAKENKVVLSLEPLQHSVITSPSFFCKHASIFINATQDGFIAVGKDASDIILKAIWKEMMGFVRAAIELGSKRERQSSEVLTMLLKALKDIVVSKELPVLTSLALIEITIKELPPKVLGSPAYQVANMDLLNGTPALFLIQLSFWEDLLKCCIQDERFFLNYESLVRCVLSGPTSPLAFSESVFAIANQSAKYLENKDHLWRIWSIIVNPLTEWINQTNEVNQGDALEHNFSAIYSALLLPVDHIFPASAFPQPVMKTLLRSWSELYRSFARCAALVATAEDNLCCEELCAKIVSGLEDDTCINRPMLDGLAQIVSVMVDCINFAPYCTKYQPPNKSPQTPTDWSKKKRDPLGKLSSLTKLLAILINSLCTLKNKESLPEKLDAVAACVISGVQNIIGRISMPSVIRSLFGTIMNPLVVFYEKTMSTDASRVNNGLNNKLEKLLVESINCLQSHYTGSFDSELLQELSPFLSVILLNKNKHIRSQAALFWNATFGKAVTLTYPEELKSLLCQAKKKILLSLPGFESIGIVGEFNGTYSDSMENSQWDTKISGIEVKSSGKRDSLLVQANELKEKNINSHETPTKMKLEFPLSKTNQKDMLLEEENTVDFVFIPPETKERVLTEHQKEVLRTKRVDIPTMYNNLDASQDTTLFSQYTQSQEDTLKKPTFDMKEEVKKEESKIISQSEKMTNGLSGAALEVTENSNLDLPVEKANLTSIEQLGVLEEQSPHSSLETSASKTALEESSVLDKSRNESISSGDGGGSSSASSDVISGTPQPISRRQSFITLETFDNSEHRSFSCSTFNNALGAPGCTLLLAAQESMMASDASYKGKPVVENKNDLKPKMEEAITRAKRSCLESIDSPETYSKVKKIKEDIRASSELQPESTLGLKKSSLRQNKTELSEDKKSKPTQLEQDKNMQVSPARRVEDTNVLLGEVKETECKLGIQSQALDLNVNGGTSAENKQIVGNVAETKVGPNLDSKENTPPQVAISGDTTSNVGPQVSPNPKTLRRSLRRRSEATEETTDSRDKENNQQKKDRRKDEDKLLPKKILQSKEDAGHQQKSASEKTTDVQGITNRQANSMNGSSATEGIGSKDYCASRNRQEETNASRKSEANVTPDPDDLPDSGPDTTGEKPKGLPRYHTRRTTQGLLSSVENSESDSSETREEGTKRKRSGRGKSKSNTLENQAKEESQSQELNSQEIATEMQATIVETKESRHPKVCTEVTSVSSDGNAPTLGDCSGLEDSVDPLLDSPGTEKTPATTLAKSTSAPVLKTRQAIRMLDKDSVSVDSTSCVSETSGDDGWTTVPSAFSSFEKPSEISECLHKRSKRARKSRRCNCCGEQPFVQLEKVSTEIQKADSPEPKLKEHKRMSSKATRALSGITAAQDSNSEESLDAEPCATSTPVSRSQDCTDLRGSSSGTESERELPEDLPKVEFEKSCVKSESCKPVSEMLACAEWAKAISESPNTIDSNSKESIAQDAHLEVETEPTDIKKEGIHQNGPLEARGDAEMAIDQREETQISEPVADIIQDDTQKTSVASVAEILECQDSEMGEEADAETSATPIATETSALEQDDEAKEIPALGQDDEAKETPALEQDDAAKESNCVDSPLTLKDALSLAKVSESPNGIQPRCIWSSSASPSTSILKRGIKRQQEDDSLSPVNKSRRVSFANPIYQEELADDIDRRRSPVVRTHSSSSSPSSRSIRPLCNHQAKLITTPTKGSLSPGSPSHKYKSSKKCLITEMVKEPLSAPTESIYPALVGCKVPVDTILPQITSNIWARGFGQLIRAKNIRTVGDLSSLTASEIKTLPIRSPKVYNVRRALKSYHEQQVKSNGSAEIADLDDTEKPVNGTDERPFSTHEDNVATDLTESVASSADEQFPINLVTQINILAAQFSSGNLHNYSGSDLFEMHEKLCSITNCIMKNLQSRWPSSSRESTV